MWFYLDWNFTWGPYIICPFRYHEFNLSIFPIFIFKFKQMKNIEIRLSKLPFQRKKCQASIDQSWIKHSFERFARESIQTCNFPGGYYNHKELVSVKIEKSRKTEKVWQKMAKVCEFNFLKPWKSFFLRKYSEH